MQAPGSVYNQGDAFVSQQPGFASQSLYGQPQQPQFGQQPQQQQYGQNPQMMQPQYGQYGGQPGYDQGMQQTQPVIGIPMQPVQATIAINHQQPVVMAASGQMIGNSYREMPVVMAAGGQMISNTYREMPVAMAAGGQMIGNSYRDMPVAMAAGGQILSNNYRDMSKSVHFAAPLLGGRKEGEWPTEFCSCCTENTWAPNLEGGCCFCFQVFLCPCICYGRNVALLTRKKAQVDNCVCCSICADNDCCNCMFWSACIYFAASACCLHAPIRQQIRELNKMPTGGCGCVWDIIATSLCAPCAIIQDYNLIIRLPNLQTSPGPPGSRVGVSG